MIVTNCQDLSYFSKAFPREGIGIKSHFFAPSLPEAKPGMRREDASLLTHTQPLGGLKRKPGSRPSLEEQAMCFLKHPWS